MRPIDDWLRPYLPLFWADANPFFLVIHLSEKDSHLVIDLGRTGWLDEYAEWLEEPAIWALMSKVDHFAPLRMVVGIGEKPYYVARHIGTTASPNTITVYGIGKRRFDGHTDRLWILPSGFVCTGDDESYFGLRELLRLETFSQIERAYRDDAR